VIAIHNITMNKRSLLILYLYQKQNVSVKEKTGSSARQKYNLIMLFQIFIYIFIRKRLFRLYARRKQTREWIFIHRHFL